MAKLWVIVKREYLERVRSKFFVFVTLFGPVFFAAIILLPVYLATRSASGGALSRTAIIDATGTGLGAGVARSLAAADSSGGPPLEVRVIAPSALRVAERDALQQVMRRQISGYLILDNRTASGDSARYYGRSATSLMAMQKLETAVRDNMVAQELVRAGLDSVRVNAMIKRKLELGAQRITDAGLSGSGEASAVLAMAIAFLLYMSIIIYGQNVLRGVMEEKTSRVAEVVVSSVRAETLMAGKVLGVAAVGLTQQLVWVVGSVALLMSRVYFMGARPTSASGGASAASVAALATVSEISAAFLVLLLVYFVVGFVFYGSLYAAAGATVNVESDAQQAAQPLVLLLVGTGVLIQPVVLNPSGTLARVMSILPFSSPIIMPLRMAATSVPPLEVAASLLVLVASSVGVVWVAARIYRVGLLMYGKRPTLREIGRWVSYSR